MIELLHDKLKLSEEMELYIASCAAIAKQFFLYLIFYTIDCAKKMKYAFPIKTFISICQPWVILKKQLI